MSRLAVAEAPEEKPAGGAGNTASSLACSVVTPAGTVRWKVYMSPRSGRHVRRCPLAVKTSPVKSTTGPVGPCSPGIHLGYTSVTGPAVTGISSWACSIFCGAWVASTMILMGAAGACAAGAAPCLGLHWAEQTIELTIKTQITVPLNNAVMMLSGANAPD